MPTSDFPWASPSLRARLDADPAAGLRDRGVNPPDSLPEAVLHDFLRITHLLWVEGRIVSNEDFRIDPSDEGLLFGRGGWESTRTAAGEPWLWPLHLERLVETCKHLFIPLDPAMLPDADAVREYVRSLSQTQDVVIRLNVSAGRSGHRGVIWMSAGPMPKAVTELKLLTRISPVEKGDPNLTLKTFQYATRLRISQEAALRGYHSALLVDGQGHVLEASHANLFVKLPSGWVTPAADGGFLPGTVRRHLLNTSPVPIRQEKLPLAALNDATELFVTNSGVGIVPVTQVDQMRFSVGEETKKLMAWLHPVGYPGTQYRFVEKVPTLR
jgi:branched-subunit amino acid aminotransferase/4-amino-4-deoxychorismate lyase